MSDILLFEFLFPKLLRVAYKHHLVPGVLPPASGAPGSQTGISPGTDKLFIRFCSIARNPTKGSEQ